MTDTKDRMHEPDETNFYAVCKECSTVMDASFDNKQCKCGGIFHIDSARCLNCGKRHPFKHVGEKCLCGGEIVPKMISCPSCKANMTIDHLGENCPKCNMQLKMEG